MEAYLGYFSGEWGLSEIPIRKRGLFQILPGLNSDSEQYLTLLRGCWLLP